MESPKEIIEKIRAVRKKIDQVEGNKQRRLGEVTKLLEECEIEREQLLARLEDLNQATAKDVRLSKARELTDALDGQIKITLAPDGDTRQYRTVLDALCKEISNASRRVRIVMPK